MNPQTAGSNRAGLLMVAGGLLVGLVAGLLIFVGWPGQWPWLAPRPPAAAVTGGPLATPAPAPVAGAPAPDFTLTTLTGETVKLSALKGQVVLINFWATWCIPCRQEMPAIQQAYNAHKSQGLLVLAVNLNEPPSDVQTFIANLKLNFPVLLDPSDTVSNLYRVRGYPTSFFIDRQGVVAVEQVGEMTETLLAANLAKVGLGD